MPSRVKADDGIPTLLPNALLGSGGRTGGFSSALNRKELLSFASIPVGAALPAAPFGAAAPFGSVVSAFSGPAVRTASPASAAPTVSRRPLL